MTKLCLFRVIPLWGHNFSPYLYVKIYFININENKNKQIHCIYNIILTTFLGHFIAGNSLIKINLDFSSRPTAGK